MTHESHSLWRDAFQRIRKDRLAVTCLGIIAFYLVLVCLTAIGWIADPWNASLSQSYSAPSLTSWPFWFGTDILGRSVLFKTLHGATTAMSVGLISTLLSIPIGLFLGAVAGYFGGWLDDLIVWLYSTLASIPSILLIIGIAFVLGKGIVAMNIALAATAWISLARVTRGEVMRHKTQEYVLAAESIGAGHFSRLFRHILPNVSHFAVLHFALQFVSAIKSEVILSYLGVGAQGVPSWGLMIDEARTELTRGVWWQLTSATIAMLVLVLAFNILSDALRDALDPRIKYR